MTQKITSADIRAALRLRFESASHALLFEVADSTGAGTRRFADAIAFGLWPSHGHKIEGVEIKVSRSDFLRELKDHTKCEALFRYCNHWWLACPKGMVTPDELPSTWGLLEYEPTTATLRQKVRAPKLEPCTPSIGFIASLLRRHAGADNDMTQSIVAKQVQAQVQQAKETLKQQHEQGIRRATEENERAKQNWQKILDVTGVDLTTYFAADDFIQAVLMLRRLGPNRNDAIARLLSSAQAVTKAIETSGFFEKPNANFEEG